MTAFTRRTALGAIGTVPLAASGIFAARVAAPRCAWFCARVRDPFSEEFGAHPSSDGLCVRNFGTHPWVEGGVGACLSRPGILAPWQMTS